MKPNVSGVYLPAIPNPAQRLRRCRASSLRRSFFVFVSALSLGWVAPSFAMDITGWTCTGSCGTLGSDGVVTLSPATGTTSYGWVSTYASTATSDTDPNLIPASIVSAAGIGTTNASKIQSPVFLAKSGETLSFYFNYVSSDGQRFADYAWARLLDTAGNEVAMLFAARTTVTGDTVPGFEMPLPTATLTPASAPIISGAPQWTPLGASSETCYGTGCGYTDWVHVTYTVAAAGDYQLEFGVANWNDSAYASGLAFDGAMIGNNPIGGGGGAIFRGSLITTGATIGEDGEVSVWGFRGSGQQGNGKLSTASSEKPAKVSSLSNIVSLTGGAYHLLALDKDGNVSGWGQSGYGETGCTPNTGIYTHTPCTVLSNAVQIAAGEYFSIALDKDGNVWTWGHNLYGQLGNGKSANSQVPVNVNLGGEKARLIGGAYEGAFAVTEEGHVWAWGDNEASGLGIKGTNYGVQQIIRTPTLVSGLTSYASRITYIAGGNGWGEALLDDGTVIGWGLRASLGQGTTSTSASSPEPVEILHGVKQLFARYVGSVALTEDGKVLTWGQTGGSAFPMVYGASPTVRQTAGPVKEIGGGKEHVFYRTEDGTLYGVGYNDLYKLDTGKCCAPNVNWPGKPIAY